MKLARDRGFLPATTAGKVQGRLMASAGEAGRERPAPLVCPLSAPLTAQQRTRTFARKVDSDHFLVGDRREESSAARSSIRGGRVPRSASGRTSGWRHRLTSPPTTRNRYEGIIQGRSGHAGKRPAASVTHAEVQRWLTRLPLAPASTRKVHRALRMVLAYAVKDGRLAVNPAAGVSLPRVQAQRNVS